MNSPFVRSALIGLLLPLTVSSSRADTAEVSFVRLSGSVAQGTAIFRADLSGVSFDEIYSITLIDSNSQTGGSPGQYSGFDLDAIKISTTLATTASEASAAVAMDVFDFNPTGTFLIPGTQRPPVDSKLNGTDETGLNVDPNWATLGAFDAIFFSTGSVTLGDGGRLSFNLTSPVSAEGLYIYLGEVSGSAGEGIAGSLIVSTLPVPEPATTALWAAGLACLYGIRRRHLAGAA
jgi:hypothetical protein